jgi:hypothetical protein
MFFWLKSGVSASSYSWSFAAFDTASFALVFP